MGIGRVMSLFSSSVVGVKLSWLFTVTLLSNRPWWWVWFGFYIIKGYVGILGFYLLGRFGVPDIRKLPAVKGEEDEGGRLCSPTWDLAEGEIFLVLYGTVGNKSRY